MSRAAEFVDLYNQLDDALRRKLSERGENVDRFIPFTTIVARAAGINAAVRTYDYDLKQMAELRNAIVHERRRNGGYIAEPIPEVLEELRVLIEKVTNPRRAYEISSKNPQVFGEDHELPDVLIFMKERQYSQVVVRKSGKIRLLSSVGVTRWLEQKVPDSILELNGVTLSEVLEHEPRGSYGVTARTTLADEVREMFLAPPSGTAERLQAVIVTHSGRASEEPVGIITPWDLVF
jgi:CBS domain-containing protein